MNVGTAMSAPQAAKRFVTSVSLKVIMATLTWIAVVTVSRWLLIVWLIRTRWSYTSR